MKQRTEVTNGAVTHEKHVVIRAFSCPVTDAAVAVDAAANTEQTINTDIFFGEQFLY